MDKKTFLDDNTVPDIDIEEEKKSDIKFKFLLIILVMIIIVISKLSKNEISIRDFSHFTYSFSFHRLYECRNYILFLVVMIPLCYFLSKSNNDWVKGEIDTFLEKEEKKEKEEEEKKQAEFEAKMRNVHFKSE